MLQVVGLNISDLVTVDGIEAALVFGDFNSQLLLRNITREANGYTISCSIRVGAVFEDAMNVPLAHVTVLWNDPFTFNASTSNVDEGGELDITVTYSANPRPNVSLERQDGNAIPDEQNRVSTTDISNDTSRLTFRSLREEDTGNYFVEVAVSDDVERQNFFLIFVGVSGGGGPKGPVSYTHLPSPRDS